MKIPTLFIFFTLMLTSCGHLSEEKNSQLALQLDTKKTELPSQLDTIYAIQMHSIINKYGDILRSYPYPSNWKRQNESNGLFLKNEHGAKVLLDGYSGNYSFYKDKKTNRFKRKNMPFVMYYPLMKL